MSISEMTAPMSLSFQPGPVAVLQISIHSYPLGTPHGQRVPREAHAPPRQIQFFSRDPLLATAPVFTQLSKLKA